MFTVALSVSYQLLEPHHHHQMHRLTLYFDPNAFRYVVSLATTLCLNIFFSGPDILHYECKLVKQRIGIVCVCACVCVGLEPEIVRSRGRFRQEANYMTSQALYCFWVLCTTVYILHLGVLRYYEFCLTELPVFLVVFY